MPKTLNDVTNSIVQKSQNKNNLSKSFFNIIGYKKTLIYIESPFDHWYKQDFSFCDHQRVKELIGYLKENGTYEMDSLYYHYFF